MGRPRFDFSSLDQRSRDCYFGFEQMGSELQRLASRAREGSAAPRALMADVDTLVTKIQTLREESSLEVPTVAFVDPDADNRRAFEIAFQKDFHVITLATSADALLLLKHHPVDILISDLALCRIVKKEFPQVVRAFVASYDSEDAQASLEEAQIRCFIPKPWEREKVIHLLRDALRSSLDATLVG